jgi:hypothetical protein
VAVAISHSNPDRVYALIETGDGIPWDGKETDAGQVFRQDYSDWYRALFSESVRAGLLRPYHLAGHRSTPVYIRASRHVPPPAEAVNDAMGALLDLLQNEKEPIVRAVLGHWLFGLETRSRQDFIKFLVDYEGLKAQCGRAVKIGVE